VKPGPVTLPSGGPFKREALVDDIAERAKDAITPAFNGLTPPHLENELAIAWNDRSYLEILVNSGLRNLDLSKAFQTSPQSRCVIDVSHNDVTRPRVPGGSALVVLCDEAAPPTRPTPPSRVIISESNLEGSSSSFPTALILFVHRCTVTGNLIQNEPPSGQTFMPSLILEPTAHTFITISNIIFEAAAEAPPATARTVTGSETAVAAPAVVAPGIVQPFPSTQQVPLYAVAVTGNVFVGFPLLPVRRDRRFFNSSFPDPLPEWLTYNTWVD
jgi:hypothetical protein